MPYAYMAIKIVQRVVQNVQSLHFVHNANAHCESVIVELMCMP